MSVKMFSFKLKESFISPDILAYPLDEGEYILDTDASDVAIGGVSSQIQNGSESHNIWEPISKQIREKLLHH